MTNYMPQMRRTLVAAANRLYQDNVVLTPTPTRAAARRRGRRLRPLVLGSTSGVLVATVAGVLLLSAGGAPTAAQALPILNTPAAHITSPTVLHALGVLRGSDQGGSWTTHTFTGPDGGTGYVAESPDGSTVCVDYTPPAPTEPVSAVPPTMTGECNPTAYLALHGVLMNWNWNQGDYDFYALVPTGGTVSLTIKGTTSTVPVNDNGIATGVVHGDAAVSLQVGSSTLTQQLGPDANATSGQTTGPTAATGPTS